MRLRQGLVLLLGAVIFAIVVGPEPGRFYLTPLGLGLAYLAAAAAGGRRGGYWATAIILVAWGLAVVWMREIRPDLDAAGVYMGAVGLGAVAGLLLDRRGIAVGALGLAGTIVLPGSRSPSPRSGTSWSKRGPTPSSSVSSGSPTPWRGRWARAAPATDAPRRTGSEQRLLIPGVSPPCATSGWRWSVCSYLVSRRHRLKPVPRSGVTRLAVPLRGLRPWSRARSTACTGEARA